MNHDNQGRRRPTQDAEAVARQVAAMEELADALQRVLSALSILRDDVIEAQHQRLGVAAPEHRLARAAIARAMARPA